MGDGVGAISSYAARIDPQLLGLPLTAFVSITPIVPPVDEPEI